MGRQIKNNNLSSNFKSISFDISNLFSSLPSTDARQLVDNALTEKSINSNPKLWLLQIFVLIRIISYLMTLFIVVEMALLWKTS